MPQLSLNQPIGHFESVKVLQSGHPVFLLVADDGSHLVIKYETTSDAENLRRNQLAMQLASPQSRAVILTVDELHALKGFVDVRKLLCRQGVGDAPSEDTKMLGRYLRMPGTWYKMNEAKGLVSLAGVARQVLEGDKTGARAFAKALNAGGGLEALGKIIGADLFNGNGDRFTPMGGGVVIVKTAAQDHALDAKALVNVGNVMAAVSGGKLRAIGLDSWDPYTMQEKDMGQAVNVNGWSGAILGPKEKGKRLTYATHIADDLNMLLGPRNRRFAFLQQTRLDPDAPQRIVNGMESVTRALISKVQASMKRPNAPAGLESRLKILRGY
jgi:hypothetical protein